MGMDLNLLVAPVVSESKQQQQPRLQIDHSSMHLTRSLDWTRTVVALVIALLASLAVTVVVLVAFIVYLLRMSP